MAPFSHNTRPLSAFSRSTTRQAPFTRPQVIKIPNILHSLISSLIVRTSDPFLGTEGVGPNCQPLIYHGIPRSALDEASTTLVRAAEAIEKIKNTGAAESSSMWPFAERNTADRERFTLMNEDTGVYIGLTLPSKVLCSSLSLKQPSTPSPDADEDLTDDNEDDHCPICQDPYSSAPTRELRVILPYGHQLGHDCLHQWVSFSTHQDCPLCRGKLHEDFIAMHIERTLAEDMAAASSSQSRQPGLTQEGKRALAYLRLRGQWRAKAKVVEEAVGLMRRLEEVLLSGEEEKTEVVRAVVGELKKAEARLERKAAVQRGLVRESRTQEKLEAKMEREGC